MLFEDSFCGSIRCSNAVRNAILARGEDDSEVTVVQAMSVTPEELSKAPNCGKRTINEFKEWRFKKLGREPLPFWQGG